MKPTEETYRELNRAYVYFNERLFAGRLPYCVITLQRKKGAYGYFWGDTWHSNKGEKITDEIALNPDTFSRAPLIEIMQTLVHEMCHLEQHHFGTPSRTGYHNKEWANMMEAVGLIPSSTGKPGGRKTGQKMGDYPEKGGVFEKAYEELINSGFSLPWIARTREKNPVKVASKTKYTCESCGLNAWGKPEINLICGDCNEQMQPPEGSE